MGGLLLVRIEGCDFLTSFLTMLKELIRPSASITDSSSVHRLALKDVGVGFSKEARQAFLRDSELQEATFQSLTMQNHKTLMRLSAKYRRLSQREQLAILAMAHNAGAGGALDYLRTGKDTADGFGTKGTKYINAVKSAFQGGEA